eukprot:CCRYP_004526-RB/>CCRYP_004526-RB protein AED:0.17 eAED:0.17 QI:212/1/1/1/0.5/0.33/3/303/147
MSETTSSASGRQSDRNWLTDALKFAVGLSVNIVSQATDILSGIATEVKSAMFGVVSVNSKKALLTSGEGGQEQDEYTDNEIFVEKSREESLGDAPTISTTSSLEFDDLDAKHTQLGETEGERRAVMSKKTTKTTTEEYDEFLRFLQK